MAEAQRRSREETASVNEPKPDPRLSPSPARVRRAERTFRKAVRKAKREARRAERDNVMPAANKERKNVSHDARKEKRNADVA